MTRCRDTWTDFSGIESGVKEVGNAQLALAKETLKLGSSIAQILFDGLRSAGLPAMSTKSCCDIPEPCWMPRALGEVRCQLAPGERGEICLSIKNCDYKAHPYTIRAAGKDAGLVTVSRPQFQLGPKERTCVVVTLEMPKEDPKEKPCCCEDIDALIWVNGCRNHYVRWVVDKVARGKCCCHEVEVNDCPDYVLHWYDHFYINRGCMAPVNGK